MFMIKKEEDPESRKLYAFTNGGCLRLILGLNHSVIASVEQNSQDSKIKPADFMKLQIRLRSFSTSGPQVLDGSL